MTQSHGNRESKLLATAEQGLLRVSSSRLAFTLGLACCAALVSASVACAGTLEFLNDQLGVSISRESFGAPSSAFAGFKQERQTANTEVLSTSYTPPKVAGSDSSEQTIVRLYFISNRLESVQVTSWGRERNNKALAALRAMPGLKPLHDDFAPDSNARYADDEFRLTYTGYCSTLENIFASFQLTTPEGEARAKQAQTTRLAGEPRFKVQSALLTSARYKMVGATVELFRDNGMARDISVKAPTGVVAQLNRISSGADSDRYTLTLKLEDPNKALPDSWQFSLLYADGTNQQYEKVVQLTHHLGSNAAEVEEIGDAKKTPKAKAL